MRRGRRQTCTRPIPRTSPLSSPRSPRRPRARPRLRARPRPRTRARAPPRARQRSPHPRSPQDPPAGSARVGAIDRRIGLLFIVFIALLGTALARASYLGSIKAGSLRKAAATQQVQTVTIPAPRGTITDRNGVELAVSEAAADVVADPYLIKDPQTAARELAPLLSKRFATVLALVTKPHTGFVYLAHLLPEQR